MVSPMSKSIGSVKGEVGSAEAIGLALVAHLLLGQVNNPWEKTRNRHVVEAERKEARYKKDRRSPDQIAAQRIQDVVGRVPGMPEGGAASVIRHSLTHLGSPTRLHTLVNVPPPKRSIKLTSLQSLQEGAWHINYGRTGLGITRCSYWM